MAGLTKRRRLEAVASVLLLVIGLAGCSDDSAQPGPTMTMGSISKAPTTTASTTQTTASSSGGSTPLPSSASTTTRPSRSSTSATSSAPVTPSGQTTSAPASSSETPSTLDAKQHAGAVAALKAYRQYSTLLDSGMSQPDKDWSKQADAVLVQPLSDQLIAIFKDTAQRGQRITGKTVVHPKVTKVAGTGGEVTITSCVDTRATDFLGPNGKSIAVPDAKGAYRVFPQTVIVTQFGKQWLIRSDAKDFDKRCIVD